jgi:spermidine synthase
MHVTIGDGRELLLTSQQKYDVIFSEPSNPYRAGIASLFTREFYQAIKQRLNPGGVFLQWVQVYEVDRQAIDLVYATLGSEFPHIESWRTHRDLLLIATNEPLKYDATSLRRMIASEPYRQGLKVSWRVAELEGLFARYVARPEYAREVSARHRGPLNTDDRNLLEFGFARSVNRHDLFDMKTVLDLSKRRGFDRPPVASDLDWETVEHGRSLLYGTPVPRGEAPAGDPAKLYALLFDRVLRAAASGRPLPPELVGRLEEVAPEGAAILAASLAYRAREPERAVELLSGVFERLRRDPWPDADLMFTAMKMIGHLGVQDREQAGIILALLREPFASRVLDEQRSETGFQIATHHRMAEECVAFLANLEPWVPWRQTLLERRVTCYEIAGSPKLNRARVELAEFVSNEPPRE